MKPIAVEISLEERVAMQVKIKELQESINKLKENPDYPLSVFVELLNLERDITKLLKLVYSKYALDKVFVD